jgi:two-component system response regulator QseB
VAETPPAEAGFRAALLLVEDDVQLSELLVELLTDAGYAVDHARDGQAGLHRGLTRDYDAMVIDRGLPAIEGVDLVSRLRSRGVTTPILILTARGTLADRVEGLDAGAEDYLVKPFEIDELLARLRALAIRSTATSRDPLAGLRRRGGARPGGPAVRAALRVRGTGHVARR